MAWTLTLLPTLAGAGVWAVGTRVRPDRRPAALGTAAVATLAATLVVAVLAAVAGSTGGHDVGGGLALQLELVPPATVVAPLVPAVAALVVAWAAGHEEAHDLPRLLGLMVAFVGAMELLVAAADLLTLTIGFELVAAYSWILIAHDWRRPAAPRAAAHAFNATRFGGLGLVLASGAALAGTGSLAYADLTDLTGAHLHVVVAGVLLAAVAKSAQGPFAPWLFSAMEGPTPVSALLHSSTMVAAGAYALVRLHPVLDRADWFGPTTVAIGLGTALVGGVVALLQSHAKKLLAASTAAQYGLMLVAVGAGYPAVAAVHLVVHAAFKAQLFLSAGTAMAAVGSPELGRMRLGRALRTTAGLAAVASLALAAVPPLGGAWSKESILAAAGHLSPGLAVAVVLAGGLSAAYATRFQLLAFGGLADGDGEGPRQLVERPGLAETGAMGVLAAGSVLLGALWLPPVREVAAEVLDGPMAEGPPWELVASLLAVALGVYAVWTADRRHRLGHVGTQGTSAAWAEWLGWTALLRRVVVDPTLAGARLLARFDDAVVDGAVWAVAAGGRSLADGARRWLEPGTDALPRGAAAAGRGLARGSTRVAERGVDAAVAGVAWLVDRAGADARRSHTGMIHHQFVVIVVGLGLVAVAAVVGR